MSTEIKLPVLIVGGGFTGLAAGYELSKAGIPVIIIESENTIGGLAAAFEVGGEKLDRFYHHWFTNDLDALNLIQELNLSDRVEINPTNTGMYYANNFFKLSTPLDVLRFKPLNIIDRIRLGLLAIKARKVKNWHNLEHLSSEEWLKNLGGTNVYKVIWEPLLRGKFGPFADQISAVWFWNKLKLRGSSRGKNGEERLVYLKGGFITLANEMANYIQSHDGKIILNSPVSTITPQSNGIWAVTTRTETYKTNNVLVTTALPLYGEMIKNWAESSYLSKINRIKYLGNVCLVLELNHSLSKTYWLNVNDPDFPFVGVIEHTNFESPKSYNGKHIVYLSKYLTDNHEMYKMSADELLEFSMPHLQKMFPKLQRNWITAHYLWKSRWSQPVVEKNYSSLIPSKFGPKKGLYLASMAQIYPEDRGTNYAIREGRNIGIEISKRYE